MGCIMRFRCATCEIDEAVSDRSLSYSTWTTSLQAFEQAPLAQQSVPGNQRLYTYFLAHRGHDYHVADDDTRIEESYGPAR